VNGVRKSFLSIMAVGALALMAVVGCGSSTSGGSGSDKKLSAIDVKATVDANAVPGNGKLVVGTDNTYAPMEYMDKDDPTRLIGFDVDLGDALSKYLNKDIVWKPTAWDGIFAGLQNKKYDLIISSVNDTPERRQTMTFVDYANMGQVILVKADSTANIKTIDDLKGKNVGVQINTTSEDALKQAGGINIKRYNTFPEALLDLGNGRLDAVVVDEPVGRYYLAQDKDKYKMAGDPFMSEPVGIVLRKDETELAQAIQQALEKMKSDGTYDKIYNYWFGTK
jgi:ABC-type amino acid transport substrate-binding protein